MTADRVPERFRAGVVRRIGHGGEATVYELTDGRVLRVFHGPPHAAGELAAFYRAIASASASFALPEIIEQGEADGLFYSVDRLIPGRPLHELMPHLAGVERECALASYTDAAFEIASLPAVRDEYGEFLRDDDSIQRATWSAYLLARMERSLAASSTWLREDVPGLGEIVEWLTERIDALSPERTSLVHGDYFPGNVLIRDDLRVSGVIDFGPLTVIGDSNLDLASALMFLEVARPGYRAADTEFVRDRLVSRVGTSIVDMTSTYRAWYAIRFSPYRDDDPNLYDWCVNSLIVVREVMDRAG